MALREEDLPVTLPETDNFRPLGTPESPLAAVDHWVNTTDPRTGAAQAACIACIDRIGCSCAMTSI